MKNHGVPQEVIDREFEVNTRYFKLPSEVTSALPQVKWASHELLGHEVGNRVAGKPAHPCNAFYLAKSGSAPYRSSPVTSQAEKISPVRNRISMGPSSIPFMSE